MRLAQLMSEFDKDNDGRVGKAELVGKPTVVNRADTTPNGELHRKEVAALNNRVTQ